MNSNLVGVLFGSGLVLALFFYGYLRFDGPDSQHALQTKNASESKAIPPKPALIPGSKLAGEEAGSQSATETAENVTIFEVLSMFYPGYTIAGATLTSVADPGKLYSTNIQSAKDGDPSAAYKVWKALDSCKHALPSSVLEQGKASGEIPDYIHDYNVAHSELCLSLTNQVDFEEIKSEASDFLALAANEGSNQAKLQLALLHRPRPAKKDIESILMNALREADHLVFDAAGRIQAEYYEYDESKVGGWRLLACQKNTSCDLELYKIALEQELYPYQYEEALYLLDELNDLLSTGDISVVLALMNS